MYHVSPRYYDCDYDTKLDVSLTMKQRVHRGGTLSYMSDMQIETWSGLYRYFVFANNSVEMIGVSFVLFNVSSLGSRRMYRVWLNDNLIATKIFIRIFTVKGNMELKNNYKVFWRSKLNLIWHKWDFRNINKKYFMIANQTRSSDRSIKVH